MTTIAFAVLVGVATALVVLAVAAWAIRRRLEAALCPCPRHAAARGEHRCDPPAPDTIDGTLNWKCPDCGRAWRVVATEIAPGLAAVVMESVGDDDS